MHSQHCGALIRHIHCAMQKNVNNNLRQADLTFAQLHLLFTLRGQPEGRCSMKELERLIGVAQSTTAGIVKRCGEKGLITCQGDSGDRRAKLVQITDKGLSVCRDMEENIRKSEEHLLENLTDAERETLICLLTKVYASLSEPTQHA